jgi:acetylornithine deacetylase
MPLDPIETLRQLVRIPSVNPMGRELSGPEYFEQAMTDHLAGLFDQLGLAWEKHEVEPRRSNIICRLEGDDPSESSQRVLLFEAHQDTVPVDRMTIDPFAAELRDGRIHGRGACDIKGGMAAMLAAFSRLAKERPAGRPTIVMACTVNEEHGFTGASHLARLWQSGKSPLLPREPDGIVVAEPTELRVVVAHKGVVRWCCHTTGRAAHSSRPERGENAIYRMARVLRVLEEYARDIVPKLGSHPLVGNPTMSVGTIRGGISVNTVPDRCTIEIDRRLLPGEDPVAAREKVIAHLQEQLDADFPAAHDEPFIVARGLPDDRNAPLAESLSRAVRECGGNGEFVGVPFGTDAAAYSAAGAAAVVFGPGSIRQAHTADEWIAVDQLERATEILYRFACQA